MRKELIVVSVFFLFFIGCSKPEDHIIEQDKMIDVLIDIHMVEASLLGYSSEQKDTLTQLYYSQIYEIHSITEDDFKREMVYLKRNPNEMKDLYEKVLEEIDKREAELK